MTARVLKKKAYKLSRRWLEIKGAMTVRWGISLYLFGLWTDNHHSLLELCCHVGWGRIGKHDCHNATSKHSVHSKASRGHITLLYKIIKLKAYIHTSIQVSTMIAAKSEGIHSIRQTLWLVTKSNGLKLMHANCKLSKLSQGKLCLCR